MSKSTSPSKPGEDKGYKPSTPPPSSTPKPQIEPAKHGHQPSSPPPNTTPTPPKK
jgi:hypothetical protein